jgi:hypothetical protein
MVELGGQADIPVLVQQDIPAVVETRTLPALDDPSGSGNPDLASMTSASVLPLSTSVLSSVTSYLDSVLISAILRISCMSYLAGIICEDVAPCCAWAREGIGMFTWN